MSALGGLNQAINAALGTFNLPSAITAQLAPNAGNTTTAVNALVVINGKPQGLLRTVRHESQFNIQRVPAIGSAIRVGNIPGIYDATLSVERSFIFGLTMEQAFGNILRPVVGKALADPDFTKSYFDCLELDNLGNVLTTHHDCIFSTITRSISIEQVVIVEDASIIVRWTD